MKKSQESGLKELHVHCIRNMISWRVLTAEASLLNVTYKVFSNILYTRLLPCVENKHGHYQVGICPRKSMINQICVLQQILEKMKEFRISIHLLFIDFKSVYDSTNWEQMYEAMNELTIPKKLIRLVEMIM